MLENIIDKISIEYPKRVLNDLLPNQMISSYTSTNGYLENIEFGSKNIRYKGSDYFVNPQENQFIHFTSFESAKEIISNNKLRLYDLNYADDPHEIIFIIKNTGINFEIDYYKLKSLLYSMSFCSYPLSDDDEHTMWRLYGKDGYGIGLVCSFHNNCEEWDGFHLGKILYTNADKITEAFSKHKTFFEELNSDENHKTEITEHHLLFNLLQLFAFHKHTIYGTENEFRLLHKFNFLSLHNKDIRRVSTINKSRRLSNYTELNLCELAKGKFELDKSKEYSPLIKIDKLVLGYRYSLKEKEQIDRVIQEVYAHNHSNYSTIKPKIEITSLKEKYF